MIVTELDVRCNPVERPHRQPTADSRQVINLKISWYVVKGGLDLGTLPQVHIEGRPGRDPLQLQRLRLALMLRIVEVLLRGSHGHDQTRRQPQKTAAPSLGQMPHVTYDTSGTRGIVVICDPRVPWRSREQGQSNAGVTVFFLPQIPVQYPLSPAKTCGRSDASLTVNSPKRVLAQANHARVNTCGSSFWKDSCIKPVPAVVLRSQRRHSRISASSVEVSARMMIDIGQIIFSPACGPPTPSAAVPRKKYGLASPSTNWRLRL